MRIQSAMLVQLTIAMLFNALFSTTAFSSTEDPYLRLNEINTSAARDFLKRFPNAGNDKWLKLDNGYVAKFGNGNTSTQVYYGNDGGFLLSTTNYREANMPAAIKKALHPQYSGYTIIAVTEVIYPNQRYFLLHVKNREWVKTLKLTSTTLELLESLINAAPR